jgi:hypothetical protein
LLQDIANALPKNASYNSSPISSNSVISGFGHDLNRDFEVSDRLEELFGFEIEPEELQGSIHAATQYFGARPTMRQLSIFMRERIQTCTAPYNLGPQLLSTSLLNSGIILDPSSASPSERRGSMKSKVKLVSASPDLHFPSSEFSIPRLQFYPKAQVCSSCQV